MGYKQCYLVSVHEITLHLICSQPGTLIGPLVNRIGRRNRRGITPPNDSEQRKIKAINEYLKRMEENAKREQDCWNACKTGKC